MKSYCSYLQGLYQAMFSDIAEQIPSLRRDCERDVSRLLSLIESRGLPFLMIDLPEMGKHFDMCLSRKHLTPSNIPGFGVFKKERPIPRLFKGLILRVFDQFGVLRPDSDIVAIRLLRQLFLAAKKVKVSCDDSRTWEHVHEFFETDRNVRLPSLSWDEDDINVGAARDLHCWDHNRTDDAPLLSLCDFRSDNGEESLPRPCEESFDAVQRTADIVFSTIGRFEPSEWVAKHGPGAVSDQRHTQFKYDFPSWPEKLAKVFPLEEFGFANFSDWAAFASGQGSYGLYSPNEFPSKLVAVPKTLKGPRLIASEPVSHQWCQQMIKEFLSVRLMRTPISSSIHFRDQSENQDFAKRASHTQSHVTIDLSSASDRLSCWLVERIFRANSSLLKALHASRTRWVVNTIDRKSPKFSRIRKFACMGSACTFPVQSYVFAIIAIGCLLHSRGIPVSIKTIREASREVRVFGDDIIVPKDCWALLQGMLGNLGLKINPKKTYDSGNFRESCGLDAFDGHDVTPTYSITYPEVSRPESIASCVETSNNFIMKGLVRSAHYVKSRVRSTGKLAIANVPIGSGAFGWFDIYNEGNTHLQRRWNALLHRIEYRVDIPRGKSVRCLPNSDSLLLQYFTVAHRSPTFLEGERLGVVGRSANSISRRWVEVPVS